MRLSIAVRGRTFRVAEKRSKTPSGHPRYLCVSSQAFRSRCHSLLSFSSSHIPRNALPRIYSTRRMSMKNLLPTYGTGETEHENHILKGFLRKTQNEKKFKRTFEWINPRKKVEILNWDEIIRSFILSYHPKNCKKIRGFPLQLKKNVLPRDKTMQQWKGLLVVQKSE